MPLVFEWDAKKAKNNHQKHRVSFDEACTVFDVHSQLSFWMNIIRIVKQEKSLLAIRS